MIVDATVWVSGLSTGEANYQVSRRWILRQLTSGVELVIPSIAIAEVVGAISRRENSPARGHRAMQWILSTPRLLVVPIDQQLGQRAAQIAADHRLRGPDAVYVAAAEHLGGPLVSWNQEIQQRAAGLISVIQP